jgi:hypothetical protein
MKKNPPQIRLKRIHLETLIDTLMDLYMGGVSYIDIMGISQPKNDIINIIVREEYIEKEEYNEELPLTPLSDEILNQLI